MKEKTINSILEIGTDLILKSGYSNVGLNKILETANIPKGSFYYYFKSKEDFGLQVIKYYSNHSLLILNRYLTDSQINPKDRIISFFTDMKNVYSEKGYTEGCLLGNCSTELSDLSLSFSNAIATELDTWQQSFTDCISEGQQNGNIRNHKSAEEMANFVLSAWQGSLLRMKSSKNDDSMEVFIQFIAEIIL